MTYQLKFFGKNGNEDFDEKYLTLDFILGYL